MANQVTGEQVKHNVSFTTFSASQKRMKLTASEQRGLFGKYIFGKKNLKVHEWGISTLVQVAYGQDYSTQDYTWEDIAEIINNNWKAGSGGRKYSKA